MTKISIKHLHSAFIPKVTMKVKNVHPKPYWQYDSQDLSNSLMEFALLNDGTSINLFVMPERKF